MHRLRADGLEGLVLHGKYELVELLGHGGFAAVYLALQRPLNQRVAVKVSRSPDPLIARRFVREARVLARLTHAASVPLLDFGEVDGLCYMVQRYVHGRTLRAALEQGPLSLDEALDHAITLLDLLDTAHRIGIVHRDIKPGNIMLVRDESGRLTLRLLDFGIAKILGSAEAITLSAMHGTADGRVLGTPQYMAPEQVRGDPVDGRTDLYLVGLVLYEMLTGTTPFTAGTILMVMQAQLTAEPAPMVGVPATVEAVVMRALAKAPEDRFSDARAMLDALRVARAGPSAPVLLGAVPRREGAPAWPAPTLDAPLTRDLAGGALVAPLPSPLVDPGLRATANDARPAPGVSAPDPVLAEDVWPRPGDEAAASPPGGPPPVNASPPPDPAPPAELPPPAPVATATPGAASRPAGPVEPKAASPAVSGSGRPLAAPPGRRIRRGRRSVPPALVAGACTLGLAAWVLPWRALVESGPDPSPGAPPVLSDPSAASDRSPASFTQQMELAAAAAEPPAPLVHSARSDPAEPAPKPGRRPPADDGKPEPRPPSAEVRRDPPAGGAQGPAGDDVAVASKAAGPGAGAERGPPDPPDAAAEPPSLADMPSEAVGADFDRALARCACQKAEALLAELERRSDGAKDARGEYTDRCLALGLDNCVSAEMP